jgi:hypothetical protein
MITVTGSTEHSAMRVRFGESVEGTWGRRSVVAGVQLGQSTKASLHRTDATLNAFGALEQACFIFEQVAQIAHKCARA